ncbi:MAG TPA: FAD-dependent oxidoreductase [Bryobacteraceae bacterium]|jgi:NADPH-dependent glutamate synthase beta subunit-like oxidoreductase/ferredoxin|nr:FAD-dependent oxidoreductase [Bryobacteraceae bacterium]
MHPTDTSNPDYFHKVVDCQWACPAHTNVPEYIRLIAQGRYTDAYMLNRESNVFPGILGRTCDRPCEPACRRGRLPELNGDPAKPVAICRLKRVAADLRGDIGDLLPKIPAAKNGKRVACIGAGPASLAVANDLMPLGYNVTIFEKLDKPGGLMRTNIPSFRLPEPVLMDEVDAILDMGVEIRYNSGIESMASLLNGGMSAKGEGSVLRRQTFDAVFVGSGAPRGKNLELPGRYETSAKGEGSVLREPEKAHIHIGIDWLGSVAFGHTTSIGERVLIIGVGNTAMDCCRSSRRLGGKDIKVMARRPRAFFKASPWELEDAEEEGVEIVINYAPKRFVIENGVLTGMEFERLEWDAAAKNSKVIDTVILPCDDVILAIGQDNAFPWIERDLGIEFDKWDMPTVDKVTFESTRPGIFFGGDAAWGPKNIIWAVEHAHQAAISIHNHCQGIPVSRRAPFGMNLVSRKMGLSEWSYHNDYNPASRQKMQHVDLVRRFQELTIEVELGFDAEQTAREVQRCLNCDVETAFTAAKCIECDACIDICPISCLTIAGDAPEDVLRHHLSAPAVNQDQALYASKPLPQTGRLMLKDEDLCVHCGLCAERCPTAAWDMQKFELLINYAGQVTPTESCTAA